MIIKIVMVVSGVIMSEVIWQLYKARKRFQMTTMNVSNDHVKQVYKDIDNNVKIFDVMFFSKDSALCRSHFKYEKPCPQTHCAVEYLRKLMDYLNSSKKTLDICMYFFTCRNLAETITDARKRGVVVRLITDHSMSQNNEAQTMYFYQEGVQPKIKKLNGLMHHKFAIIDNSILITGSINWTMTAFFGNFENILVTNESALVKPYVDEFERVWTMLDDIGINSEKE